MSNWIMTTESITKAPILVNLDNVQSVEEDKRMDVDTNVKGCHLNMASGGAMIVDEPFETFRERVIQ